MSRTSNTRTRGGTLSMMGESKRWRTWRDSGDDGDFRALVDPHLAFLSRYAAQLGAQPADADDAVQDALAELAGETSDRPPRVGLRAWLARAVRSRLRMGRRSAGRRRRREETAAKPERVATDHVALRDEIRSILARFDDDVRELVALRFLHDLEYKEVAFVVGSTAGAVRVAVHRALKRLRRDLGDDAPALLAAWPLTWGGALMSLRAKSALVALVLVAAGTVWQVRGGRAHTDDTRRTTADRTAETRPAGTEDGDVAGSTAPVEKPAAPAPEQTSPSVARVPLDAPIAPGKGSVAGRIRYRDGTPVRGLRVALWGASDIEDTTDEDGRFHLHNEWVQRRDLYQKGPGGYALTLAEVDMKLDARVEIDVVLERGETIAAQVIGPAGPVAGAVVTLRQQRPGPVQGKFGMATTDGQGRFRFDRVVLAGHTLDVQDKGYETRRVAAPFPGIIELAPARKLRILIQGLPAEAEGQTLRWMLHRGTQFLGGAGELDAGGSVVTDAPAPGSYRIIVFRSAHWPRFEREVEIGEGEPEPLLFTRPGGARVEGVLVDARGQPLQGTLTCAQMKATTDKAGRFVFARLRYGRHSVRLRTEGGAWVALDTITVPAPNTIEVRCPGTASVRGRFKTRYSQNEVSASLLDERDREVAGAAPGADGSFALPHLAPGDYTLRLVRFTGDWKDVAVRLAPAQVFDAGVVDLAVWPELDLRVVVPAGAALPAYLRVTVPVARGVRGTGGPIDGKGVAKVRLPAGRTKLRFQADGYQPITLEVDNRPGAGPIRLEFTPR